MENRVRIYRRNSAWVVDTGGRQVPNCGDLHRYLPNTLRNASGNYWTIEQALQHGINPQSLTTALSAWYTEHPNVGEVLVTEGSSPLPDTTAYMALGDRIYKMVPVRQAGATKAIRVMREKMREESERLRTRLQAQVQAEFEALMMQARERAAAIRNEAEQVRAALSTQCTFPDWTRGYPVKRKGAISFFLREVPIITKALCYGEKHWRVKGEPIAIPVWLWLPIAEAPNPEVVHLRDGDSYLPHVTTVSSCMKIGERIPPTTNYANLCLFERQVQRTLEKINLASLLISDPSSWDSRFLAVVPDAIVAWLRKYPTLAEQRGDIAPAELPPADYTEEGRATWSL